jgi:replicative DNA helicase
MCFCKGTLVRLFDGSTKKIEDIVVGDLLMGDDSTPRKVLSLYEGMGNLYRIKQSRGCDYYIDEQQLISLEKQDEGGLIWEDQTQSYRVDWAENHLQRSQRFYIKDYLTSSSDDPETKTDFETHKNHCMKAATDFLNVIKTKLSYSLKGAKIDLSLSDYLSRSDNWKSKYLAYKASIEYKESEIFVDPYILGLWLAGDSQSGNVLSVSQINPKLFGYLNKFATLNELKLINSPENPNCFQISIIKNLNPPKTKVKGKKMTEKIRNIFKMSLKSYQLTEQKHIPLTYLINTRSVRLGLLAGCLDRSGYFNPSLLCYELNLKSDLLADQIIQLCHSLGWYCKKHLNLVDVCYKILISGTTLYETPTLLEKNKIHSQIKNQLPQTIELTSKLVVDKWDNSYYYGF